MEGSYVFIVLLLFSLFHLQQAQDLCNGRSTGVYTFPQDITKYVLCASDDTFMMTCPKGLVFNEQVSHCTYGGYSNALAGVCGDILHHDSNRKDMSTGYKLPNGWTLCYIDTDDRKYYSTPCENLLVNIARYYKTSKDLIKDGGDFGCWHGHTGSHKGPSYASNNVIANGCRNGIQQTTTLNNWDVGITTLGVCIKIPEKVRRRHIRRDRGFCRGKIDGVYPFQNDCSKFITCVNDNMFVSQCPPHLLFDDEKHHCNYEWGITRLNCTQGIQSDVVLGHADFGDWGSKYICPDNGYINGFRLKVEDDHDGDNTAINGIEVSCTNGETGKSNEFSHGSWKRWQNCSRGQHVWSFNFRSEKYSETGDNTGGNDVNMVCTDNVKLLGGGNRRGSWVCQGAYCSCSHRNATLCGIQTKGVEEIDGDEDAIGVTKMNFICCERH